MLQLFRVLQYMRHMADVRITMDLDDIADEMHAIRYQCPKANAYSIFLSCLVSRPSMPPWRSLSAAGPSMPPSWRSC